MDQPRPFNVQRLSFEFRMPETRTWTWTIHPFFPIQSAVFFTISSKASSSERPELFNMWNEWSPPFTTNSSARLVSRLHSGLSSLRSASASREPWRKSIGTSISERCSPRSSPGLPAACRGKPKRIKPRTLSSGWRAAANEVMRPPIDLPPAKIGRSPATFFAAAHAARTVSVSTASESGRLMRFSMYGNWYRSVATSASASFTAARSMNRWRIPAPAPCANRSNAAAVPGFNRSPDTAPAFSFTPKWISFPAVVPMLTSESDLQFKHSPVFAARPNSLADSRISSTQLLSTLRQPADFGKNAL